MRRSFVSAIGAVVLAAIVSTHTAHAAVSPADSCTKLLRAGMPADAVPVSPYVVHQETEGSADFTVLWIDAAGPATRNSVTSCTFHDVDRDGRHDRTERVFAVQEGFDVDPEAVFGRWPYSVVLTGVAEGEQVCTTRALRTRPVQGGRSTTTTSAMTCFPLQPTFGG